MFTVRRSLELDAGHRVPFHESGCRRLHGHRYRVTVVAAAPDLVPPESGKSNAGMVVDFGVLKQALVKCVHDPFDHRLMLWAQDPLVQAEAFMEVVELVSGKGGIALLPCIPTAEELAKYWGVLLALYLERVEPRISVTAVEVRETPTSTAIWDATPAVQFDPSMTIALASSIPGNVRS